jgi:prepilin-type N-terminal cleavage/methylation domain-containing protein
MFIKRLSLNENQQGFTLIELLVSIAIMALILPGTVTGIYLINKETNVSNNRMAAINSVQNVGNGIVRDARMSDSAPVVGALPNLLTLSVKDFDGSVFTHTHLIIYSLSGGTLTRSESIDGGAATISSVARNVSSITASLGAGEVLSLTVTSTVPAGGMNQVIETRVFNVSPRA